MTNRFHQIQKQIFEIREVDRFLSKRLAKIREIKGVSPDLMASELAISIELLAEYEAGAGKIPAALLCRMSQVLCVGLSYIFNDEPLSPMPAPRTY